MGFYRKSCADDNIVTGRLLGDDARNLIISDGNAFLFGLISDQSVRAETAWSLPLQLKRRMGHLHVPTMAAAGSKASIEACLKAKPALHRYPGKISEYIHAACEVLCQKYGADARAIWDGQTAGEITTRLGEFKGISRKKAALGTMVLVRDLGVQVPDRHCIDIAVDVHVHRVFLRAGFAAEDSIDAITSSARAIHPSFPGEITTPVWVIGREYCRPEGPLCAACPLASWCRKDMGAV